MPKLSAATRDRRRNQILDAARSCIDEHGLEAVSIEMIIARSGLSTGTVYRYFDGKDAVVDAAVVAGTRELLERIQPMLELPDPPPPGEFLAQILQAMVARAGPGPVDLTRIAVHGWSHSRSRPVLAAAIEAELNQVGDRLTSIVRHWQSSGVLDARADPSAAAELLTTILLGFLARRALLGASDIDAHAAAFALVAQAQVVQPT